MFKYGLALVFACFAGGELFAGEKCSNVCENSKKPIVISHRGVAGYSIVLPEDASASQEYAASELATWIEKVLGAKLPILRDNDASPQKGIFLGETKLTRKLAGSRRAATQDGFRLVVKRPHLFVIGSRERGTLYGVYEVLERFAGCRWYSSWHSLAPKRERIEVPADLDEIHDPDFAMREPYWYDVIANPEFAARLRVNSRSWRRIEDKFGGEPYRFGKGLGSCHTFDKLLPPEKYFASHPEYFSMMKGRRIRERTQPCLTNPDVLRIVTSNVLEHIRKDPEAKFYGVSQNDWYNYCECSKCKAVDDEEESHAGTLVRFVNAIAAEVEKEFPHAVIETLAYQYTRKAPKKTKPRRNVMPCLCTIECDFSRPLDQSRFKENVSFCRDIADWSRLTDFLYVWDYTTDFGHYLLPWANVHALQGNLKFFRRHGVKAIFAQGAHQGRHADFAELKAWLLAKWMWNGDLPMGKLLDDFFAGYYGRGAPYVREYFEKLHRLQSAYSADPERPLLIFDGVDNPALDDAFLEDAASLWEKAADAVKGERAFSYNVRMGALSVDYARLERANRIMLSESAMSLSPEKVRSLAQSVLRRMDEAGDIRIAEADRSAKIAKWRKIADGTLVPARSKTGELEEDILPITNRGKWGDYVDDPKAANGRALKLFNSHFNWCTMLSMSNIVFEPGRRYRLRIRVRFDKAADGEAFWAGIYSKGASRNRGSIEPRTGDAPDGEYRWYDVVTWVPASDEYFWIGPGRFDKDGKSAIKGVYIDKIEFVREDKTK